MTGLVKMREPKIVKQNDNTLQLYARASAPSRDYYGLTITDSSLILNIWKISYGPHTMPKQKHCSFGDFKYDKAIQEEIKTIFGDGVYDYLSGLSKGLKKLENLPTKHFLYLLSFLHIGDILNLMCCSKILFELCNQEEVWRSMFVKKFGRSPSKEEKLMAMDSSWKELFKKRLAYVRKALKESQEKKMKKKMELKKVPHPSSESSQPNSRNPKMDHNLTKNIPLGKCARETKELKQKHIRTHPYRRLYHFQKIILSAIPGESQMLFTCVVCENVLNSPVTVKCGHTICLECLDKVSTKCRKCAMDIEEQPPKVNILVQTLIEKWKERNKMEQIDIPVVILLLHPRYVLRSGCAGLQYSLDIKRNMLKKRVTSQMVEVGFPRKQLYERILHRRKSNKYMERFHRVNQKDCESFQKILDNVLKELENTIDKALRNSWSCVTVEDLECLLCRRCLIDPVTTPCGHTFCRDCLTRVLDHRLTCPLCVSKLSVSDYFRATTKVLDQAVRFLFPKETPHCSIHRNHLEGFAVDRSIDVPVFVCTNAFPGVACPLYVYEPRYRLLARRCLQSPLKRFAMASIDSCGTKFAQYGTILEVKDAVTLEDGRIILSTQGVRRFRVIGRNEKDGYDTARIEHLHDIAPTPEQISDLVSLHRKVYGRAVRWIHLLSPSALSEVERLIGKMPKIERDWISLPDGPSWTWWLIPILPLSSQLQVGFLSSTSLEKRLRAIDKMLEHMKIRMKAPAREESVSYARQDENNVFCSE